MVTLAVLVGHLDLVLSNLALFIHGAFNFPLFEADLSHRRLSISCESGGTVDIFGKWEVSDREIFVTPQITVLAKKLPTSTSLP